MLIFQEIPVSAMELEKLLCPQCGGNDLETFGLKAFKCRFCGAVLKMGEPEKMAGPPATPEPK
jgi:tRNA(Ile2) C34 agmatinyltransferase TiaS